MLEACGLSDPGQVRTNNEDYYLLAPELGLYLVADGIGGALAGEQASRLAARAVERFFRSTKKRNLDALREALEVAHQQVVAVATKTPQFKGMGTTLVVALEAGEDLLIASVGDSRAYEFQDSRLRLITKDQTWAQEIRNQIGHDEASLRSHPMRHVLTMAIGANSSLKTQTYTLRPTKGTQILLCSDGLHDVIDKETIVETLDSEQSLEAKCHYLVEAAIRAGGPDNITAVLLRVL